MLRHPGNIQGIYSIKCKANGKVYIGKSVSIPIRWSAHRNLLEMGRHINTYLQKDYILYGKSCFEFLVEEEVYYGGALSTREQFHMNKYPKSLLYNINNVTTPLKTKDEYSFIRSNFKRAYEEYLFSSNSEIEYISFLEEYVQYRQALILY